MPRASVDITGGGAHTIYTPGTHDRVMLREVYLTFAHDQQTSLRVWFNFGANLVAGPFYVTDGGEIRYKQSESPNTYKGGMGEPIVVVLDPNLKAAGLIDYEVGSW